VQCEVGRIDLSAGTWIFNEDDNSCPTDLNGGVTMNRIDPTTDTAQYYASQPQCGGS
jgi:hypothetical protein